MVLYLIFYSKIANISLYFTSSLTHHWVPGHIAVEGNEMADKLVRKGGGIDSPGRTRTFMRPREFFLQGGTEKINCSKER